MNVFFVTPRTRTERVVFKLLYVPFVVSMLIVAVGIGVKEGARWCRDRIRD